METLTFLKGSFAKDVDKAVGEHLCLFLQKVYHNGFPRNSLNVLALVY